MFQYLRIFLFRNMKLNIAFNKSTKKFFSVSVNQCFSVNVSAIQCFNTFVYSYFANMKLNITLNKSTKFFFQCFSFSVIQCFK